jgi:hypothetical protein
MQVPQINLDGFMHDNFYYHGQCFFGKISMAKNRGLLAAGGPGSTWLRRGLSSAISLPLVFLDASLALFQVIIYLAVR